MRKLLTDEIIEDIVRQSNNFAAKIKHAKPSSLPKWKDLNLAEMWQFLAMNFMMAVVKKPSIREYWTKHPLLETPGFAKKMSRDR